MTDIAKLTNEIATLAARPPADIPESERAALYAATTQLRDAVRSPLEAILQFGFEVYEPTCLQIAFDAKLFDTAAAKGGQPVTVDELARPTGATPLLVGRIMKMLTSMGLFAEVDVDAFAPKPLALACATGSPLRDAALHLLSQVPAASQLPAYLKQNNYQDPNDAFKSPWQFAQRTDKHYFDWLANYPELQQAFNVTMGLSRLGQEDWFKFYPVEERLAGASSSDLVLADIGGGVGHDVLAFQKHFPTLKGRFIFEDLPPVAQAGMADGVPKGVTGVGHDFFQPQPDSVKGAKLYILRTVLHDWPDKQARVIIRNIKDVMTKGSRLLVNEHIVPEKGLTWMQTSLDLSMAVCFSSLDRTEKQMKELVESEGLKFVATYRPSAAHVAPSTTLEFVLP